MLSLPTSSGDAASLIETHDKIERHLRSLDSLQPGQDMILYSIVLSKLPRFLKIEAHRRRGSRTDWGLNELRGWLQEELRARDLGERMHKLRVSDGKQNASGSHGETVADHNPRRNNRNRRQQSSAAALVSQAKEIRCAFCGANHASVTCRKYPDVDARRAQLRNRCYLCLDAGHTIRQCPNKKPCSHCKRAGHHESICYAKIGRPSSQPKSSSLDLDAKSVKSQLAQSSVAEPIVTTTAPSVVLNSQGQSERTIMQTALVLLEKKGTPASVPARLFFDTGASRSFITEAKYQELSPPVVRTEWLSVSGFRSSKRHPMQLKIIEFDVKCRDGSLQTVSAAVVPTVTCPILKVPIDAQSLAVPEWSLAEPLVDSPEFVGIDVLIGMDHYYCFVTPQHTRGGSNLWFLSSKAGFLASGRTPVPEGNVPETVATMLLQSFPLDSQPDNHLVDLSTYWELEKVGVGDDNEEISEDAEAWTFFKSTVRFDDGRYCVCWPWKTQFGPLRDNFGLSVGRLKSQLYRLNKLPELFAAYSEVFRTQLDSGVIEYAPTVPEGEVYYMPHHSVANPNKPTTKLRVVFDASSKTRREFASLNECLHRGPVLLEDLCGLLLRFRTHRVALGGDIEKAFLQIGLQQPQRDVTRFLWVRDVAKPASGENLIVYRYCRVPFGVISSPFLLAATIRHHLEQHDSSFARVILRDIYVDNLISGESSVEKAFEFYRASKQLFSSASMNIREWYSNSSQLTSKIAEIDRGRELEPKMSGLRWNLDRDTLRVEGIRAVACDGKVTKRSILKTLPQLFDPCGFWAPVSVLGKLMMQQLWTQGFDWDSPVPTEIADSWCSSLVPDLKLCSSVEIPRHVRLSEDSTLQLHTFCDASQRVCAAVTYLRVSGYNAEISTHLLMAKTRLAPVKQKLTIPKMEVVAATLGSRLAEFVFSKLALTIDGQFLWTDSQCVLCWLNAKRGPQRFVQRRIDEILRCSSLQFRFVPSESNPADSPTKGSRTHALEKNKLWWQGPIWLRQLPAQWPITQSRSSTDTDTDLTTAQLCQTPPDGIQSDHEADCSFERVIDETRYGSLTKLLCVTSYVFRFFRNLRNRADRQLSSVVTKAELVSSLHYWVHRIQHQHFPQLFRLHDLSKQTINAQLDLFRDPNNILRCRGRIDRAAVSYEARHPALLPKNSHCTELVVLFCHREVLHAGVAQTLARVRQQFWIVHGRSSVKRILRSCRTCRRFEGGSLATPSSPPLPLCRIEENPPFACTGVDYLGPLGVQVDAATSKKAWICLFTCAVVRAVHLEVVEDMSTEHFLLALRRFIASHGCPSLMLSDNGRQFQMAAGFIRRKLVCFAESEEFRQFAVNKGLE